MKWPWLLADLFIIKKIKYKLHDFIITYSVWIPMIYEPKPIMIIVKVYRSHFPYTPTIYFFCSQCNPLWLCNNNNLFLCGIIVTLWKKLYWEIYHGIVPFGMYQAFDTKTFSWVSSMYIPGLGIIFLECIFITTDDCYCWFHAFFSVKVFLIASLLM